jgi:hypothetical protein
LLLGFFSSKLSAQTNLTRWIDKCTNLDNVEATVIHKQDSETGKKERTTIKIIFSNGNRELQNELIDAFNKDKPDAVRYAEKNENGQMLPDLCRFLDKQRKMETRFVFHFNVAGENMVLMTVRDDYKE